MIDFIQEFNTLMVAALVVSIVFLGVVFDAQSKTKRRRGIAEIRRQKRQYQAELASLNRAHTSEIVALREAIRFERNTIRPHDAIQACAIERRPLLNREEFPLFDRLEAMVATLPNKQRLFSQVSLLEIFYARALNGDAKLRLAAFDAFKAARVDFLIVNRAGYPVIGIEYQGSGHHQGNAAYRDQIKRELFRKAGVPLVEVDADYSWDTVEPRLREIIRTPILAAPSRDAQPSGFPVYA